MLYLPKRGSGISRWNRGAGALLLGLASALGVGLTATGVAPLPPAPSQKAVLPPSTPTPTSRPLPDFAPDKPAPTNAGVLSVSYSAVCKTSSCTFNPKVTYPPSAVCTFDAGDGTAPHHIPMRRRHEPLLSGPRNLHRPNHERPGRVTSHRAPDNAGTTAANRNPCCSFQDSNSQRQQFRQPRPQRHRDAGPHGNVLRRAWK